MATKTEKVEVKVPYLGGTLVFQDPFDFTTEEGENRHIEARVLLRGDTKYEIAVPYPAVVALAAAWKVEAVKEWIARNKPQ